MVVSGVLDGVALFEGFTRDERAAVAARGRVVDVPTGAVLVRQDDDADALFVLLDGEVKVYRWDAAGGDVELGRRFAGECFGEMALIDGGLRSATVEAVVPCRVFALSRQDFFDVIAPSPLLLSKLLRELSLKIRDVSQRVVQEDLDRRSRAAEAEVSRHRAMTQVVTGLAHELNTPLGICITTASHLAGALSGAARADFGEAVDLLVSNLARCASLMDTLSAIAALNHAEPLEPLDLHDVIGHASALFAMERPEARLAIRVQGGGPTPWLGYRGHLERALRQVFENAVAHAYVDDRSDRERSLEISFVADRIEGRPAIRIEARDFGVGPPVNVPSRKLFEAFFTTKRAKGFKGLGLTMAFNAVTGPLGGRIRLEPAADGRGGAVVSIIVPREL